MKSIDLSLLKYGSYSEDIIQNGVVDATDNGEIDIDAATADNYAANFVSAVVP